MKKIISVMALAALLAVCVMPNAVFAIDAAMPTGGELEVMAELYGNMFIFSPFEEGTAPADGDIFDFIVWSDEFYKGGELYEYLSNDMYTIPYDAYMSVVDKYFVNHTDMKEYFGDDYDSASDTITVTLGGYGGYGLSMFPVQYACDGENYYVLGVRGEVPGMIRDEIGDDARPHYDYYPHVTPDFDEPIPYYFAGCYELSLVKTSDGIKINGLREINYYMYDGLLYERSGDELVGIYRQLSINIEGDGAYLPGDALPEGIKRFEHTTSVYWLLESAEIGVDVATVDGCAVTSVTYEDDGGVQTITADADGHVTVATGTGPATLTIVVGEKAADATSAESGNVTDGSSEVTTADENDESGCGSVLGASAAVMAIVSVLGCAIVKRH